MQPLRRLAALVRPERRRVAAAVSLQVVAIGSSIGLMGASAWLLSAAALHPSIAVLQVAIVGVRAFGISRAAFRYLERLVSHDLTLRILGELQTTLFRALVPLAPARLLERRRGDLITRVLDDVGTLESLYARLLGPTLGAGVIALLLVLVLRWLDRALPAAAIAGLFFAAVAAPTLAARLAAGPGRRFIEARSELGVSAVDGVLGVADLLAFGREGAHATALREQAERAAAEQARLVRASSLGGAMAVLGADLTALAVLALAIPSVRSGRLDAVQLATAALVTLGAFEAIAPLPQAWHALGAMHAAATRVFGLESEPSAVTEPFGPPPAPLADAPLLEIRGLRFTYPGGGRPALDGIDLRLEVGQRVAVVGSSGSGKSTLAHLLLRFWDAPPASVLLQGRDLCTWPSDLARGYVSFAAQRAQLFTGTLRDNLLLARPDATDDELRDALASLQLGLERLPSGLDTPVGEEGRRLSGGERQRLALARALLREAPLLLLDEPTAHLDALTERAVMQTIRRTGKRRATLLVTHRLVALEGFDEIVVLEKGRVAERGTAAQLMARRGVFARLANRQRSVEALGDDAFRQCAHAEPDQAGR